MSTMTVSPAGSAPERRTADWRRYVFVAIGTIGAAVLANVLLYALGSAVTPYDPEFLILKDVSATMLFTIVPAIAAVLLYALLLRFTANPERNFTIIAAVVLIASLIPDITYLPTVPGASTGQIGLLMLMHVVAAVVIVGMLTTFTPASDASRDR